MTSRKNKACTLKVGQIEKDPILALSTSEKDVEQYARVAQSYGAVTPAIVGQSGDAYRMLAGQSRLEACARNGIREIPAIVTEISDAAEQMKLALLLSSVREESGSLSEGAFINALIERHGVTRRELAKLLKKSKSWICKRLSLATRLSENVKGMVRDGVLCARTAEAIAKLPEDVQCAFADRVAGDGLSKTSAEQLVNLYTREETDSAVRAAILESPLAVLDTLPIRSVARRKEKRGLTERISGNAGFIFRLINELKGLLAKAEAQELVAVNSNLNDLRDSMEDLKTLIDGIGAGVLPGKSQEGAMS